MAMLEATRSGCGRWGWTWCGRSNPPHFKSGFGAPDHPYGYLMRTPEAGLAKLREALDQLAVLFPISIPVRMRSFS